MLKFLCDLPFYGSLFFSFSFVLLGTWALLLPFSDEEPWVLCRSEGRVARQLSVGPMAEFWGVSRSPFR